MNTIHEDKNNELRIVYMGTPDFAVSGLQILLEADYTIAGVITAPDKPAGRGRKIQQSAVKVFAVANGLKVLQPTNLKSEDFLTELRALDANLFVVVAFRMLPKVVWQMPALGTFNLHASLLPQYRGAAPINWAIINGETKTGVTTFFIDEKIDTGAMILQEEIAIESNETAGQLHDRLMQLGANLILKTVNLIADDAVTLQPQPNSEEFQLAPKIHKDTCKIDWSLSLKDIFNHIRGLSPYPGAWTTLIENTKSSTLKIYLAEMVYEEHNNAIGTVVYDKKNLKIATSEGYIKVLELQLPGKRKMRTSEALNGLSLSADAKVE